ncbi:hypothetical protein V1511DRAFT_508803 [Dipodascopsis uninucleata]
MAVTVEKKKMDTESRPLRRSARVKAGAETADLKAKETNVVNRAEKSKKIDKLAARSEAKEDTNKNEPPVKKTKVEADVSKDRTENAQSTTQKQSKELEIGDDIPDVSIADQNGEIISLKKVLNEAKGPVVIFAYPKASTPGCTRQACGFRDNYDQFTGCDALVFGLSADKESAQMNFKQKQSLPYSLLADTKFELIGPLGAKKTAAGGIIRSYWIFKNGKLVVKKVGVKPEESVEKALQFVKSSE